MIGSINKTKTRIECIAAAKHIGGNLTIRSLDSDILFFHLTGGSPYSDPPHTLEITASDTGMLIVKYNGIAIINKGELKTRS